MAMFYEVDEIVDVDVSQMDGVWQQNISHRYFNESGRFDYNCTCNELKAHKLNFTDKSLSTPLIGALMSLQFTFN